MSNNETFEREDSDKSYLTAPLLVLQSRFASTSTGSMELVGIAEGAPAHLSEFEAIYRQPEEEFIFGEMVKEFIAKKFNKFSLKRTVMSNFPILKALRRYKIVQDLPSDIVAGLTSGIMMIPQGMAFASLSTLPPIVGLYISLFSSLTYFFLGTGQQMSYGCIAILSIMMGSILDRYESRFKQSSDDLNCTSLLTTLSSAVYTDTTFDSTDVFSGTSPVPTATTSLGAGSNTTVPTTDLDLLDKKLQLAGAVTFLSGIIFVVLGKIGFGKVTVFMSDALVTGVTVGVAFHVGSSQLQTVFGLSLPRYNGIFKLINLWVGILSNIHRSNVATLIVAVLCTLLVYLVKRFVNEKYKQRLRVPLPIELFMLILVTLVTFYADLNEKFNVSIIKEVPVGVPSPRLPDLSLGVDYLADGLIIIIVAFAQTVSIAKLMGLKHGYTVDSNQEMFALGMVNVVCALFSGYIPGGSVSRTIVQDSAGGRTQIASLFAAALVLLVMLFMGPYFYHVPSCALSAIILVSLRSLFLKLLTIPEMWRKSKLDCLTFAVTCAAVVILDADLGLLVGIGVSILLVLFQTVRSSVDVVAHISVGELSVWRSKEKYQGVEEHNVKVVRINCPLYFVNAEIITNAIFKKTGFNPLKFKSKMLKNTEAVVKNESCRCFARKKPVNADSRDGTYNFDNKFVGSTADDAENRKTAMPNGIAIVSIGNKEEENIEVVYDTTGKVASLPVTSVSCSPQVPFTTLILDLSGVSFTDLMGVSSLQFLIAEYNKVGVGVLIVNVSERCLDILQRSGFMSKLGENVFLAFETIPKQLSPLQNEAKESTKL